MRAATSSAPGAEGDAGATVQGMEAAACILASLIVIAFFGLLPGLIIVSPCTRGRRGRSTSALEAPSRVPLHARAQADLDKGALTQRRVPLRARA